MQDLDVFGKAIGFLLDNSESKKYKAMKTILYSIPIYFLTNKIHSLIFDRYDSYVFTDMTNFFKNQQGMQWVFIYAFLYVSIYCLEKFVLPMIFLFVKPITIKNNRIYNIFLKSKYAKEYPKANESINYDFTTKAKFYSAILTVPLWITICLLNINSITSYIVIFVIWVLTYLFMKIGKNVY